MAKGRRNTDYKPSTDPSFTGGNAGIGALEKPVDKLKTEVKIVAFLWLKSSFKYC